MCLKCDKSLDAYWAKARPEYLAYDEKIASLWAELEAQRDAIKAEYEAKRKPFWDEYLTKRKAIHPEGD